MKNFKNIFIKVIPLIILFTGIGIANADTRVFTYDNSTNLSRTDTHNMTIQVTYSLDKESYKAGEQVHPIVNYNLANVVCSNSVDMKLTFYPRDTMEIGKPDPSKTISDFGGMQAVPMPSGIYYNNNNNTLDYNGTSFYEFDYDLDNNDNPQNRIYWSNIAGWSQYGGINSYKPMVQSLTAQGNYIYGTYSIVQGSMYGGSAYTQIQYHKLAKIPSSVPSNYRYGPVSSYTPGQTVPVYIYESPIKSGTKVFGINGTPSSIDIPKSTQSDSYVAQLTLNPSYQKPVLDTNVSPGSWNSLQTSNDIPPIIEVTGSTVQTISPGTFYGIDGWLCYNNSQNQSSSYPPQSPSYGSQQCTTPGYTYNYQDGMCHYGQYCSSGSVAIPGGSCVPNNTTCPAGQVPTYYTSYSIQCVTMNGTSIPTYYSSCNGQGQFVSAYKYVNDSSSNNSVLGGRQLVPYATIQIQGSSVGCGWWCDIKIPSQIIMTEPFSVIGGSLTPQIYLK